MIARLTWLLLISLTVCCVFASAQSSPQVKKTITKTDRLDFGAGGTIAVTGAPIGSIKIVGSAKNEIEIVAQIEVQAGSEADALKLAESSGFLLDESRIRASIMSVGVHNKFGAKKLPKEARKDLLTSPLRIDYVITVPRYSDLEIDGGRGDVSVSRVEGSIRINSLDGNTVIEGATGNASVSIGSGSLMLAFSPRGWHGRTADVQMANGDVTVRLPSSFNVEIDATVLKAGSIENLIPEIKPRDRKVPFTERSMVAKYGFGGPPLRFVVGSGKIKFERLN
jgi:hypothetical protein